MKVVCLSVPNDLLKKFDEVCTQYHLSRATVLRTYVKAVVENKGFLDVVLQIEDPIKGPGRKGDAICKT